MAIGLGGLGLAPKVFWSMTLPELQAAVRGRFDEGTRAGVPPRAALGELMTAYPDNQE